MGTAQFFYPRRVVARRVTYFDYAVQALTTYTLSFYNW